MRQNHCRVTSTIVTQLLCEMVVHHLKLNDYNLSVPAKLLAKMMVLCTALTRSLSSGESLG